MRNLAAPIGRAKPLRHYAFAAEPARFAKHNRAILFKILVQYDTQMRAAQQLREQSLASCCSAVRLFLALNRLAAMSDMSPLFAVERT
jgi:hypothetical protein